MLYSENVGVLSKHTYQELLNQRHYKWRFFWQKIELDSHREDANITNKLLEEEEVLLFHTQMELFPLSLGSGP